MSINTLMNLKHSAKCLCIQLLTAHILTHILVVTTIISDAIYKLRFQYGIGIVVKENKELKGLHT